MTTWGKADSSSGLEGAGDEGKMRPSTPAHASPPKTTQVDIFDVKN